MKLIDNWKDALKMHSVQLMLLGVVGSTSSALMQYYYGNDDFWYFVMFGVTQVVTILARLTAQPELEQ